MKKELLAAILLLQLAACGGGGGGGGGNNNTPNPNPNPVPEEPNEPEEPVAQPRTLTIQNMAWLQVVQQDMDDEDAVLASNKETRVRVDVTSERNNEVLPTNAQLTLCSAPTSCESFALVPNSINAPQTINYAELSNSYVAVIPANKLTSDLTTYTVHVDTNSPAELTNPLFKTGSVSINDIRPESLVIRQVMFQGQTGEFPSNSDIKKLLERTYPQSDLATTSAPTIVPESLTVERSIGMDGNVYIFPLSVLNEFMNEMDMDYCRELSPNSVCITAWPTNVRFVLGEQAQGSAMVGGYANGLNTILNQSFAATDNLSVTTPYGADWLSMGAGVLVHEFGHLMNLGHAACGVTPEPEDVTGYPDGRIGANGGGYDVGRNFYFTTAGGQFADFMSYCPSKNWTADVNYLKVIGSQRLDSSNPVLRARVVDGEHLHDHASSKTTKQYLGFYRRNGAWTMKLVDVDPSKLKPFNGLQKAGALHPALTGFPLKSVQTHFGQPETGPFFVPATVVLKSLISEGPLNF